MVDDLVNNGLGDSKIDFSSAYILCEVIPQLKVALKHMEHVCEMAGKDMRRSSLFRGLGDLRERIFELEMLILANDQDASSIGRNIQSQYLDCPCFLPMNVDSAGPPKRLLVAEDDKHHQILFAEELSDEGYEVNIASNGKDVLSMLNNYEIKCFDLIILDIKMPKMDGLQAMEYIIKSDFYIPVIIYTGYAGYIEHPMARAADAYIIKSHDMSELKNKIRELLKRESTKKIASVINP